MLRYFVLEILVPVLIFTLLRSILRSLFQSKRPVARNDAPRYQPQPQVVAGGELKRDPVCGTYVSTGSSVTRQVNGQLLHFCSTECRDKYRAA
jgi:YHS domain-containing protein